MNDEQNTITAFSDHPPYKEWEVEQPRQHSGSYPSNRVSHFEENPKTLDIIGFRRHLSICIENLGGLFEIPVEVFRQGDCRYPAHIKIKIDEHISHLGQYPLHAPWVDISFQANEGGVKVADFIVKEGCIFDRPITLGMELVLPVGSRSKINPANQYSLLQIQSLYHASPNLQEMYEKRVAKPHFVPVDLPKKVEPFSFAKQLEQSL